MARQSATALLLFAALAFAALAAAYLFIPGSQQAPEERQIRMSLDGREPLVSGANATVFALSSCGAFAIYLDGRLLLPNASRASIPLALEQGSHTLEAANNECSSTLSFEVLARECEANQTRQCDSGGCGGVQRCEGGVYSPCYLPRKTCTPGEKIGCSTDGCKFGYAACNACGTGFGQCLPGNGTAGCSGNCTYSSASK
jgi:hypothetical protein